MNGEENKIMDEPMDSSVLSPTQKDGVDDTNLKTPVQQENGTVDAQMHISKVQNNDISEDCDNGINHCENSNNTEGSDHVVCEDSQDPLGGNDEEHSVEDDIHEDEISTEVPEKVVSVSENGVNTNGICSKLTKSQPKSNTIEQPQTDDDASKVMDTVNNQNPEDDSESVQSDDGSEVDPKTADTVSIHSDSGPDDIDTIPEEEDKNNDIGTENETAHTQNGTLNDSHSSEVQEVLSDNEQTVVAKDKKPEENKVSLRRSSRAIKRKRYTDEINGDGSDLEEVATLTPLNRKSKPIVINDTKALVEMAAKQMRAAQNAHKKEPTIVIIDSKSPEKGHHNRNSIASSTTAQQLYQTIAARGTTVTPVSCKSGASSQTSHNSSNSAQNQPILPSLTDDMFVVEAPSFIVPYVYEKPSIKPFREFVDTLGKELEEEKAKEEKELLEKKMKEKELREKERQERRDKGEEVEESEDEAPPPKSSTPTLDDGEEKKKKKKEKRKRNDDDDASWDGDTSVDSDDEVISDEEGKTVIIKDKADSIEEIKDVANLTADKVCTSKSDNYFDCSLGKFFVNIGLSLVQEYVQTDLLKQQTRKLNREKKTGQNTRVTEVSIASLKKNLEFSKENNAPYSFKQKKCEFCSFKSESMLAMSQHLDTPHMKNNVYKCNFCTHETRSPHDILYHMEAEHKKVAKLERAPAYHQCANCPFEDNGKNKLARHLIPCAKKFKPELNLAPPVGWEPPAKIPKIARSRNNMAGAYPHTLNRSAMGTNMTRPIHIAGPLPGAGVYRPRGRAPITTMPRAPVHGVPIVRSGVMLRHNSPVLMPSNYPIANNPAKKSTHQPSISITPLPRQPHPQPVLPPQPSVPHDDSKFVICEICDGYIKDLEQLRNHMQWIHKVKIHPKMIYNRPPLNCQKCQFRFFTDQGLERHLLGSHGLVTSSMQEAANKLKDAGRCPVCGRVYQWRLLNHVARDHNLTLKPAHLSYKCTVCTATFGMYKQFESHVYSAHSVVAKRVMDKSKGAAPSAKNDSLLKPLKINDEITIIPQPVKAAASAKEK